jgi:hypothetical protein
LRDNSHEDLRISLTRSTTGNDDGENGSGAFASKPSHWNHFPDRKLPCCGSTLSFRPLPRYLAPLRRGFFLRLDMTERLLRRCPIPKTTRKAPSGVRTSSHATNGIAAFAVSASCTRRWYANTLPMSTMRPCRRACTNTSTAQFGGERNSHDLAANSCNTGGCPRGSRMVRSDVRRGGFRCRKTASLEKLGHGGAPRPRIVGALRGDRFSLSFTPSTLARHRFPKPNDFSVLNVPRSRLIFLCIVPCLRERL